MKNPLRVLIVLAIILLAVFLIRKNTSPISINSLIDQSSSHIVPTPAPDLIIGPFEGTVPCADCEGIQTTLTLFEFGKPTDDVVERMYQLDQVYIGKSDEVITQRGEWDYLRGNSTNVNATIYGLNLDDPKEDQIYFLKISDMAVKLLDKNMNEIPSNLNYTLLKEDNF